MNRQQRAWVVELKCLLRRMPKSLELIVRHNSIDVCEAGARTAYFREHGDADNVPTLTSVETLKTRLYPGGESL
jgi:hypothetical protein